MKAKNFDSKTHKAIKAILENSRTGSAEKAALFFKTGPGHYAEHDQFMGVTVPTLRKIAKNFLDIPWGNIQALMESKINEERLLALFILVHRYKEDSKESYDFYVQNLRFVNNWNLVDASAHYIVGAYLWNKDRRYLLELAKSEIMWERRISIVATWYFIKQQDLEWTFKIAQLLLEDKHDLIHKAVGWMLREAGKKNEKALTIFLDQYALMMPRTMLRYAIERLAQKYAYLEKRIWKN